MLKFAVILLLICLLFRWAIGKWPWQMLAGAPTKAERLKAARKLLGVRRVASREDILAAHKQVIARVHPDRGGSSEAVHEANDARDLLLEDLPDEPPKEPAKEPAKTSAQNPEEPPRSPDIDKAGGSTQD